MKILENNNCYYYIILWDVRKLEKMAKHMEKMSIGRKNWRR